MKKLLAAMFAIVAFGVTGCGNDLVQSGAEAAAAGPGDEIGKKEQAFELFDGVQGWLVGKIQAAPGKTLRVCLQGSGMNAANQASRQAIVRGSIMAWVDAIRPTSTVSLIVSSDIVFTCPGVPVDVAVDWSAASAASHRAFVWGSGIHLFAGDTNDVVLHEFGHVFGLGDTYVEGVWTCKPGQPNSAMCSLGFFSPQSDDIRAIREAYAVAFNTQSTLRWHGSLNWCTTSANQIAIGDFNGDGRSDMLCYKNTGEKWVSLAQSDGTFGGGSWYGDIHWCGASNNRLLIGKFNNDNRSDMLCHNTDTGEKWILYATAAGGFDTGSSWYSSLPWCRAASNRLHVGRFNDDGQADMLCHDVSTGGLWVALADSNGQFSGTTHYIDSSWCVGANRKVVVGDFDGNGRDDLVCHDNSTGEKWTRLSDSSGSFTSAQLYSSINWCAGSQLFVGDFGGSTTADLLCHSAAGKKWMAFGGSGTFAGTSRVWDMQWCYASSNQLFVGDFDGNGVSDMLCHDVNSGSKWISFQGR